MFDLEVTTGMTGITIVAHPLLAGMRFQKLKLGNVPVSDEFRKDFDSWLLEMFGTEERALLMPNKNALFVSPKQMVLLRNFR